MNRPTPGSRIAHAAVLGERRTVVQAQLTEILADARNPLVWEIGCGHGHFLTAYAAAHPGHTCIGVDQESSRVERALRKRDRAQLRNLHFIRAEARLFLEALPVGCRFDHVFVLFPDPWPKLRHHKHRLLQPEFLQALAAHAAPDSRLCFRTDHAEYFAEVRRAIGETQVWRVADEPWPFEFTTVFQSRAAAFESLVARRT